MVGVVKGTPPSHLLSVVSLTEVEEDDTAATPGDTTDLWLLCQARGAGVLSDSSPDLTPRRHVDHLEQTGSLAQVAYRTIFSAAFEHVTGVKITFSAKKQQARLPRGHRRI